MWEILDETEAEKYLGRKLCFGQSSEVELQNRLSAGWAAFHRHKQELCSKHYRTRDRVRLFDAVVSPTVLYGSAAWTLTSAMERKLRTAWQKMLRYVFRIHRCKVEGVVEDWIDYMQRSTSQLNSMASSFRMKDWVTLYRRRKYNFAAKVVRATDDRWSKLAIEWAPTSEIGRN